MNLANAMAGRNVWNEIIVQNIPIEKGRMLMMMMMTVMMMVMMMMTIPQYFGSFYLKALQIISTCNLL